jgi:hypothetical protein
MIDRKQQGAEPKEEQNLLKELILLGMSLSMIPERLLMMFLFCQLHQIKSPFM